MSRIFSHVLHFDTAWVEWKDPHSKPVLLAIHPWPSFSPWKFRVQTSSLFHSKSEFLSIYKSFKIKISGFYKWVILGVPRCECQTHVFGFYYNKSVNNSYYLPLSTCFVVSTTHVLSHLILRTHLWESYLHFTSEKIKAER